MHLILYTKKNNTNICGQAADVLVEQQTRSVVDHSNKGNMPMGNTCRRRLVTIEAFDYPLFSATRSETGILIFRYAMGVPGGSSTAVQAADAREKSTSVSPYWLG